MKSSVFKLASVGFAIFTLAGVCSADPVLTLQVDVGSGVMKLMANNALVTGYEIDSVSKSLVPANWTPLSATNSNFFGGSDATSVSEAAFIPQSLNGSTDLGKLFKVDGSQDLAFFYLDPTGAVVNSTVTYVPEPTSLGLLALGTMALVARRRRVA